MRATVVSIFLVMGCAKPAVLPEIDAYLTRAIDSLQAKALERRSVDWEAVRSEAYDMARGATSLVETYPIIRHVLSSLHDNHSFLQLSDSLRQAEIRALGNAGDSEASAPPSPSPFGTRMQAEFALLETPGNSVGFVFMPQGIRDDAFATAFQSEMATLSAAAPCGWIVDLRGNGGGNMWPMLAGLGPVLGNTELGGSVDADGRTSTWIYRKGSAIYRHPDGLEETYAQVQQEPLELNTSHPIAVLHDRGTGSSGEAMAISFRGHTITRSFGEMTSGSSTSTRGMRLSDGANMVVATAVFTDRNGVTYPNGLEPDQLVPSGSSIPERDQDRAVLEALQWLSTTAACGPS
ncbi:MAG: S41 family peptidase [Planctomycetota bacterium]|nr:S41 family peptidase [Planctomycetota bacterium]